MNQQEHWDKIYSTRSVNQVGWYSPHLETSVKRIEELRLGTNSRIIDVGGGASTLVDDLVNEGYRSITVVDLSQKALALAKERLGEKAESVRWLAGDITHVDLPANHYDLWHDRAVFHFLTSIEHQQQYRDILLKALNKGGHLLIATFAPEAPPKCSGLPVQRYTPDELQRMVGPQFELRWQKKVLHITPGGVEQMYLYCHFQRLA